MRVALVVAILLGTHPAVACNVRQSVVVQKAVKQQAVVVAPHQNAVVYGHGFQQAVLLNQVSPYAYYTVGDSVRTDAIVERLARRLEEKIIAKLRQPAAVAEHPGAALMAAKCASCHKEGTKAVAEKGAPTLFDAADKWIGTRDSAIKAITLAKRGQMPPQPAEALNDDEYLSLQTYLDSVKGQ